MECRLSGVVSDDAAGKFVPAVAHCAFEALWREGRLDEQWGFKGQSLLT